MAGQFNACLAGGLGVLLLSTGAFAQSRPDVRAMTCAQVQALLQERGSVTFTTGANTFERYVRAGSCDGTRVGQATTIATSDTGSCQVHICASRYRRADSDNN